jgi:GxxExxY protein
MLNPTKPGHLMSENELASIVLNHCFQIHSKWGPGLLESVYEALLAHKLRQSGLKVECQQDIPFYEEGVQLDVGFRADIVVENKLLVELKSVEEISRVVPKVVLTYIRILDLKLALIINFGASSLKDGIKRVINGYL